MDDRQQRDATRLWLWLAARLRLDRLQLAAGWGVDDVPSPASESFANHVRGAEIAGSPALDALVEQLLSFGPIRSFWL